MANLAIIKLNGINGVLNSQGTFKLPFNTNIIKRVLPFYENPVNYNTYEQLEGFVSVVLNDKYLLTDYPILYKYGTPISVSKSSQEWIEVFHKYTPNEPLKVIYKGLFTYKSANIFGLIFEYDAK